MSDQTSPASNELPEPINTLWKWLHSLPIATGVIIALSLLAALGTLIPQAHLHSPVGFDQLLIDRFGAQRTGLIKQLGLHHVYFTPYFFTLLLWLGISSVVCTTARIKKTLKQYREPRIAHKTEFYTRSKRAIVLEDIDTDAADKLAGDLTAQRFRVRRTDSDGTTHIYADRGFLQRWAIAAIHISVIILLLGAVYGKIFGTEGYIRMPDGTSKTLTLDFSANKHNFIKPLLNRVPQQSYELSQDSFRIDWDKKIKLPDMFEHVDSSQREYYQYFVKDYISELTVSRNGASVSGQAKVNHPIRLGKLNIYQSGYQQQGYLIVEQDGKETEYPLPSGMGFVLGPDGPVSLEQARSAGQMPQEMFFTEQVKGGPLYIGGELQGQLGPMTLLQVMSMGSQGATGHIITTEQGYTTSVNGEPAVMKMSERMNNYSDFSYKLDPGIPVLYFGWILLTLGITLAMYISFTQVNIRLENGRALLLVGGQSSLEAAKSYYRKWRSLICC